MTKQNYVIFLGIILIIVFVFAGAVFVREKRESAPPIIEPAPITPPVIMQTPPIITPPTADTIKDFSQAKEDCKNEQCQKIINEFQRFIDAPLVDIEDWNIYENEEYEFSFKYPKDWIKIESKDESNAAISFFDKQTYDAFQVEGATDGPPGLHFSVLKNKNFPYPRSEDSLIIFGPYNVQLFYTIAEKVFIQYSVGLGEGDREIIFSKGDDFYIFDSSLSFNSNTKLIKTIINSLQFES